MTRPPLRRLAPALVAVCALLAACGNDSQGTPDGGGAFADAELPPLPPDSTVFVPTDAGSVEDITAKPGLRGRFRGRFRGRLRGRLRG
jgi:ABC-type glycerol-3-phosphate transport system substrate-binding protein